MHVNLAEEAIGGVLLAAELVAGAVVAAEAGTVEALRWSGALPLLLRDLGARKVVSAEHLWACIEDGGEDGGAEHTAELLRAGKAAPDRLVLLLSGFLWDYEARLARLLALGIVRRVVVCSSLSERAHECFDPTAATRRMDFRSFAASLAARAAPVVVAASAGHKQQQQQVPAMTAMRPTKQVGVASPVGGDDEWGWNDDEDADASDNRGDDDDDTGRHASAPPQSPAVVVVAAAGVTPVVEVVQLPLHFAALLASKVPSPEPSVFVLCHPLCAAAFPLLLSHVVGPDGRLLAAPPTADAAAIAPPVPPAYTHAKDVALEHIPSDFRRSLRLLAHTLGEMLVNMRLDFKERIFTMGATSLKIGHTLQRIVNELQEDMDVTTMQSHQAASVIILDRTSDLASPTSFGVSLLDRVLALLPQTPTSKRQSSARSGSNRTRRDLHVTEIFPLHGCEPSPLAVSPSLLEDEHVSFRTSTFLANVQWKGGASLCHPTIPSGANAFRSLAFRPAKLALRDLDKRLQEVEHELVRQRKITKTGSTRRPGEQKQSTRGRDVVLRRICSILEAGEPTSAAHSSLIELGIIVLETLERMEQCQRRWDTARERAARHVQLRRQGGGEWILPELADSIQRNLLAGSERSTDGGGESTSLQELLTLLVHAFTLSAGAAVEDYTLQMIRNAVSESILETAVRSPDSVKALFPELFVDIAVFVTRRRQQQQLSHESGGVVEPAGRASLGGDFDDDEWDWNDNGVGGAAAVEQSASGSATSSRDADGVLRLEAKAVVEAYVERLFQPLKECAQLFAKLNDDAYASTEAECPRSLVAQICRAVTDPATTSIPELEHIVDASEQLTRAGIDMLKSGFSRFGFGGGVTGPRTGIRHQLGASSVIVVFVVGGITFEEIQEVHDALGEDTRQQIILGGTTVTNSEIILQQLFKSLRL